MSVDPTIIPSIHNPAQQMYQRIAAMEARMQAQERRRDLVVTPFDLLVGGQADVPYYGARLWLALGGNGFVNAAPATGNQQVGVNLKINGVVVPEYATAYSYTYATAGSPASAAVPFKTLQFSPSQLASSYGVDPGESMALTFALNYVTTSAALSGLAVERPVA